MAMDEELRRRLVECVRDYRAERGGKVSVSDLRFEQIEDEACALGDALAAGLIAEVLSEQAAAPSASACCPRCRRPASVASEPEPRRVQTRRGEVGWQEPKYYCRHCRQAFFPSVPHAGH
jgi:hypothetical protein